MTTNLTFTPSEFAHYNGTALVTGGSGGIGAAIVRALVSGGAKVALTYRNNEPKALLEELGDSVQAFQLDVSDSTATKALIDTLVSKHGGIHTLVHAAGPHVELKYLSQVSPEEFAEQINNDLVGFFNVVSAALPILRESSGSIIVVTSAATRRYPSRDGLSASPKGGIEALARALAVEEGRYGIRVNCVGPGMLTDGMAERLIASGDMDDAALEITMRNIPLKKFGRADDIAQAVVFLASSRAGFITGQKLDVDGGYTA